MSNWKWYYVMLFFFKEYKALYPNGKEPFSNAENGDSPVPQPYKELLYWSVFRNMQEMAVFMWERGEQNLAQALMAVKLYNLMVKQTKGDDTLVKYTDDIRKHSKLVAIVNQF